MLIAHVGPKEKVGQPRVIATGDLIDMAADVCMVLSAMVQQLNASNPDAARAFQTMIRELAVDESSPMWTMEVIGVGYAVMHPKKEE